MERGIIPIIGKPGSGKSRLGRELERSLLIEGRNVLHISVGDQIRKIGSGAIESLYANQVKFHLLSDPNSLIDDALMERVMRETFGERETYETDLLLLDGMPRHSPQIDILNELARAAERSVRGVLVTEVDDETALLRLLMMAGRDISEPVDPLALSQRVQTHKDNFPDVIDAYEVQHPGLSVVTIDTSGDRLDTVRRGLEAVGGMLDIKTL